MKFSVLTLFPAIIETYTQTSIIGRACQNNCIEVETVNFRDFSTDPHNKVDESPFGGGSGMVLTCQPIYDAWQSLQPLAPAAKTIVLTPTGKPFNHAMAKALVENNEQLVFLCGHYEGFDHRLYTLIPDIEEVSLGDFVLTGGELPALAIMDAVTRLVPGAVQKFSSVEADSFYNGLLDYPHYTRPAEYKGLKVPDVLLSGHHQKIQAWRQAESLRLTREKRPDLLEDGTVCIDKNAQKNVDSEMSVAGHHLQHRFLGECPAVGVSDFVRRQTADSDHSYFDGSWEDLLTLVRTYWSDRKRSPSNPSVFLVPMPSSVCSQFYTSTVSLSQIDNRQKALSVRYEARAAGELPYLQVFASGCHKAKAKCVEIVLYSHEILAADGDAPEPKTADFYIVSINAYASEQPEPMSPMTMARNLLHLPGGTKPVTPYTSQAFAESIVFWNQHVKTGSGQVCEDSTG